MWFASGIAQRKIAEHEAGYTAVFDNVFGAAHDHGGYAVGLQVSCGQTDRLVTDGSVGDEYG